MRHHPRKELQSSTARIRFTTPRRNPLVLAEDPPSGESWPRPTPIIRQHFVSGVHRARILGASIRIATLMPHDVLLVVSLHLIIGAVRARLQPLSLVGPAVSEIVPHGVFPRVEMVSA